MHPHALPWTSEHLYFDSDRYFESLLSELDRAKHSIDIEMYIFNPDDLGRLVEKHLEAAARRGVKVRLIIDGIGALSWIGTWKESLISSGVQIRIWNPIYSGPFWSGILRMMRKRGFSRFFFHLNRRTHRKYVVVDRELAFVGSQNVSNVHVKKFSGKQAWQDLGIVVKGPGLAFLQNAFDHAWDRSYTPEGRRRWFRRKRAPRLKPFSPVRLNLSPWLRRKFWRDLLYRIRNSKERIWITTPYLAPTRFLLRSLMKASRRGVDVRILLPASSDVFFMRWIATSYYRILVGNGVRVFEYKPRFLHAKSIVLDDWAILGTTNMNVRSFLHDLEVDIVVTGENTKQELASNFESMLKDAKEITNGNITQKFWSGRLGRLFSKVLRYWV